MLMSIARKVYLTVHSEQEMHCLVNEGALAVIRHHLVSELVSMQAFDSLHSAAVAVWHLQRVLAKKRDPLSHTLFSDALRRQAPPPPWSTSGALPASAALEGCRSVLMGSSSPVCRYAIRPAIRMLGHLLSAGSKC